MTRRIKAFNKDIKVLILTSHEAEEEVSAALSAGANAYCMKDSPSERLIEIIKAVNDGALWLDPRVASRALDIFSQDAIRVSSTEHHSEASLTTREREVLRLVAEGMSNSQIAKGLSISIHTAKAHVCSILEKLSVADRIQAAVKAINENMV